MEERFDVFSPEPGKYRKSDILPSVIILGSCLLLMSYPVFTGEFLSSQLKFRGGILFLIEIAAWPVFALSLSYHIFGMYRDIRILAVTFDNREISARLSKPEFRKTPWSDIRSIRLLDREAESPLICITVNDALAWLNEMSQAEQEQRAWNNNHLGCDFTISGDRVDYDPSALVEMMKARWEASGGSGQVTKDG